MIKNHYTEKIIHFGLKYGKYKSSIIIEITNKLRNHLYSNLPRREIPKIFCYENNNKPKENFYRLRLPREIKDEKILILRAINEYKKIDNFFNKFLINPLVGVFGSSLIFSLYNLNSIFVLITIVSGFYSLLKLQKLIPYNNIIIDSIYLNPCGERVIINTLTNKFEIDIMKIRKIRMTEMYLFKKFYENIYEEFIPIVINYEIFLIPKSLEYIDKEILFAISNSVYLENK